MTNEWWTSLWLDWHDLMIYPTNNWCYAFTYNFKAIFFFSKEVLRTFYQSIGISSEVWSYGPCLTNFIQLSSTYCKPNPCTPQGSHFLVQHFSMWHFTINMKSICLCISDRSCQFLPRHLDIFRNLKLCSLFDKLHTTFFKLLYSESHEHHKALISWYSNFHVAEPWSGTVNNIWQWIQPTFEDKVT